MRGLSVPVLILLVMSLFNSCVDSVKVIQFKTTERSVESERKDTRVSSYTIATRDLTLCFRVMSQYYRGYLLIMTGQLQLWMKYKNGFFNTKPLNDTTPISNDQYSRYVPFCSPREPGKWMSMCLAMKLEDKTQDIKVFQNGLLCWEKIYRNGNFDWLYFKDTPNVEHL